MCDKAIDHLSGIQVDRYAVRQVTVTDMQIERNRLELAKMWSVTSSSKVKSLLSVDERYNSMTSQDEAICLRGRTITYRAGLAYSIG